jgi:hypothetical protein
MLFFVTVFYATAEDGVDTSQRITVNVTTRMELQVKFTQTFIFPVFAGMHPLTENNNLRLDLSADITPVSVNGTAEFVLTPVAFLQLVAGGAIGSGWNIPLADGLRINEPGRNPDGTLDGSNELTGDAFDGFVWTVKGGGVFQFDLAAVKPGDWDHVVFRTYHGLRYRALTTAGADDSWVYENDTGEERNGWWYYGNYFLGYQMPLPVSLVGILVEEELFLYTTDGQRYWGDDISRWIFGLLVTYDVSPAISVSALLQARTKKNYEGDTGDYDFYQLRNIDRDDPRSLEFYRFGLSLDIAL